MRGSLSGKYGLDCDKGHNALIEAVWQAYLSSLPALSIHNDSVVYHPANGWLDRMQDRGTQTGFVKGPMRSKNSESCCPPKWVSFSKCSW